MQLYGVDPEILKSDQMSLHRNESSGQSSMDCKRTAKTTYVKEKHSFSWERITVMTSVASGKQLSTPKVEFVFKGNGKRVNLNVLQDVTVQRLICVKARSTVHRTNSSLALHQTFTLNDYSTHLDPTVKEALWKKGISW